MFKKNKIVFIMVIISVLLFTSQTTPSNINGFVADTNSFEILNNYRGRSNVLKVDGSKTQWSIARFSLAQYRGKIITIEFSVDIRREGTPGDLNWQVNNQPNYPSIARIENAESGVWHRMTGRLIITPTDNSPSFYLSNWENNSQNTIYYIANPVITITEGDPFTPDLSLTPLKTIYENNFLIGNITDYHGTYMFGKYLDLLKHHYNVITSSCTYPQQLAPANKGGAYRFTDADNIINIARINNIPVFGHVLIWHEATPAWLTEGSKEEVLQNMNDYITTVLRHFRGRIYAWDVVNEAIKELVTAAEARGDWRRCVRDIQNPWFDKLGVDYIELAFRAARVADPNIILYYNDYGLEDPNKAEVARKMIQDINDRYKRETGGTRNLIEGIGSQSHVHAPYFNINNHRRALEILTRLGIEIAITELDIYSVFERGTGRDTVMSERDEIAQALIYARLFNLYKEFSAHITRVTFWGMSDNTSWLSSNNPTLFDWRLNAKQAFHAVSDPDGFIRQHGGRTRR